MFEGAVKMKCKIIRLEPTWIRKQSQKSSCQRHFISLNQFQTTDLDGIWTTYMAKCIQTHLQSEL